MKGGMWDGTNPHLLNFFTISRIIHSDFVNFYWKVSKFGHQPFR